MKKKTENGVKLKRNTKNTNGVKARPKRKKWSKRGTSIQKGRIFALKRQLESVLEEKKRLKELTDGARHTIESQSNQIARFAGERGRRMMEEKKISVASALSYMLWEAFEEIGTDDTKTIVDARLQEYMSRPGMGATIEQD